MPSCTRSLVKKVNRAERDRQHRQGCPEGGSGGDHQKLLPGQLDLFFEEESLGKPEEVADEESAAASDLILTQRKRSRKSRKPRIPEDLPIEEEIIDPPEVKAAPGHFRCIGQEVTDQLDYHPGRFTRKRTTRRKFVPKNPADERVLIAELPAKLQDGCLATPGLIAELLTNKYCYHLPYYRQQKMFRQRHRIDISRQNMVNWESLACDWLKPLYHSYRRKLLGLKALQIDETCIKYIEPGSGVAQQGYLWAYTDLESGIILFDWHASRAHTCLNSVLLADEEARRLGYGDFAGLMQTDAYPGYDAFGKDRDEIELAGCWAHTRRKFGEALPKKSRSKNSRLIALILRQIGRLYAIEEELRPGSGGPRLPRSRSQLPESPHLPKNW